MALCTIQKVYEESPVGALYGKVDKESPVIRKIICVNCWPKTDETEESCYAFPILGRSQANCEHGLPRASLVCLTSYTGSESRRDVSSVKATIPVSNGKGNSPKGSRAGETLGYYFGGFRKD